MKITVNGEAATVEAATLLEYLNALAIDPRRVAVELNREILPKSAYESTPLNDGDVLEIVHFVGGGARGGGAARTETLGKPEAFLGERDA